MKPGLLDLADLLKALADPTRLELVAQVAGNKSAEACVCDLTEIANLSQGTVSHHLKILVESGIFEREQRGKWAYFSLTSTGSDLVESLGIKVNYKSASRC